MTIFKLNMHRGKKFVINGMIFGFCFTRIMATTLRIVWACYPTSVQVGMAAMIFVYAGIILLFIANLFFSQRVVRAQHPHFGWTKPASVVLPILFVIIVGTILTLIATVILEFYSLKPSVHAAVRDIQLYAETLYAIVAFMPIPIVLASTLARQHPKIKNTQTVDKFGAGRMKTKIIIILVSSFFLTLGASFRAATVWITPFPIFNSAGYPNLPPWYYSKACFYLFNFTIEWCVTISWLFLRIDKRFIIPNGAKGPFSYGGGFTFAGEPGNEKPNLGQRDSMRHIMGSSQASGINSSRVSWGGSRNSMARESRVSWGGISREDVSQGVGEDGVQVVPYPGFEDNFDGEGQTAADVGVEGAEAEMGWDPKSGKWALRPVSNITQARPVSTNEGFLSSD